MPKGYTTKTKIENYLIKTIDSSFSLQIDDWIESIEEYIDQETGRNFVADATESARYFDGDNSSSLLIDDAVSITEIKIGDTVMSADTDPLDADGDYILYPDNYAAKKIPISKIVLRGSIFPKYPLRCLKITGKWGYSATVPALIELAATVLVAGIINYSLNPAGKVQSKTIGRYTVSYKTEQQWQDFDRIDGIFKKYKKFSF